ncbi:MAG: hypothetical protein HQL35_07860 [Alphaproteobacteria bacterium]|nr:hypothetical protein [Alphaproteobacteria bacterium]
MILAVLAVPASPVLAAGSEVVECEQPLPKFALKAGSKPHPFQIEKLCRCIWDKLPAGGWERRTAQKIKEGGNPGLRGRAFVPLFQQAVKDCGGDQL